MNKLSLYTLLALFAVSCTISPTENGQADGKVEVRFGQSITIGSRTAIGNDGAASWSKNDKIALWAQKSDGSFEMANQTFSLHHFSQTYGRAIFSAHITPLSEQSYTYYATYPVPNSVSGNIATFYLPATQDGSSNLGSRDIMVARPTTGAALTEDEDLNLNLGFTHKMHTLRLQLQDTKLNGVDIDQVILEFPTNVVGDVMVDITNPDAAPTIKNALSDITVLVPNNYTAGDYLWATIFPANLSGEISYRVCAGEYTSRSRSISLDKIAKPQRVTPMSMPIPEPVTAVYIAVTENYLGEDYNTISIYDANDTLLGEFPRNDLNTYYLDENVTITSNQVLTIRYDSDNAVVTTKVTAPIIQTGLTHRIESEVPYLLFEDGSGIHTSAEKGDARGATVSGGVEGTSLDSNMNTAGWSAARFKLFAGQSMRVNVRHESAIAGATRYSGRLDSPAISGIKNGKSVKVRVTFNMGSYANSGYGSANEIYCVSGVHSNSGEVDGVQTRKYFGNVSDDYSRVSGQFSKVYLKTDYLTNYNNDSFGETFPEFGYTVEGCTSSTRLCWIPCCVQSDYNSITQAHYYIYIDNVRVQIVK